MKRLLLGSSLLLLFISITSLVPAKKHKYSSLEAKLSVIFPGEFETTEEASDTYRSVKSQATIDDIVFLVIYTVHDLEISETEKLAQISMDAFMEGLGAEPTKTESWKIKKNDGLQAKFEASGQGLIGDYRVVIIDQIQYQITAVGSKESWNEKMVQKFMKSIKIKK